MYIYIYIYIYIYTHTSQHLNGIKVQVFFIKNIEKKHLCCHDQNYYYFWKSNIPVIDLVVESRNLTEVSKNLSL